MSMVALVYTYHLPGTPLFSWCPWWRLFTHTTYLVHHCFHDVHGGACLHMIPLNLVHHCFHDVHGGACLHMIPLNLVHHCFHNVQGGACLHSTYIYTIVFMMSMVVLVYTWYHLTWYTIVFMISTWYTIVFMISMVVLVYTYHLHSSPLFSWCPWWCFFTHTTYLVHHCFHDVWYGGAFVLVHAN